MGFSRHTVGPPGSHALLVAPPGERYLLHLCEGFASVEPGNTGVAFITDEIEDQVRKMEAAGVHFVEPLQRNRWGGMAKFEDPDGNVFWLVGAPKEVLVQESTLRGGPVDVLKDPYPAHPKKKRPARPRAARRARRSTR